MKKQTSQEQKLIEENKVLRDKLRLVKHVVNRNDDKPLHAHLPRKV